LVSLTIVSSFLACRVDNSGLGVAEMPVLPHDGGGSGSAGAQGAAGDQGAAGMTGGAAGNLPTGVGGALGAAGDPGSGTAGAQGAAGDQGTAGAQGAAGDQGTAGAQGAAGDQGAAGAQGAAGDQGAAGTSGAAGTQGTAGATGAAGSGGHGGAAGDQGTAGTSGVAGSGGSGGAGGATPPACGPKTCANGCCDATGKCVAGRTTDSCGHGGAACAPCGGCMLCNASGACDVDPSSTWDVVCVSAVVAPTQPNGQTWDPKSNGPNGPNPDPFCQFEMPANTTNPNQGASSPTIVDSFTPMWNYDVTPASGPIKASDLMSTAKTWRLWIGDDDGCTARGCVGQEICEIDQPLPASALVTGQLTRQNLASCISLTVKFVCMP
jgi:hypothetical protein